jgi:hypothetical protein
LGCHRVPLRLLSGSSLGVVMPRVDMPVASWESLLFMLSLLDTQYISPTAIDIMYTDISTQVYSQEL